MIKQLLRRKKRDKLVIYWDNCDIPAKLFYNEVLGKGNYNALGKASMPELKAAFAKIIDELFIIENNKDLESACKKREKISMIQSVISTIQAILHAIVYLKQTQDQRDFQVEQLNKIEFIKVKFKTGLTNDDEIIDEVRRVQNVIIGQLENRLKAELGETKKAINNVVSTFERDLVSVSMALELTLPDTMSLRMFAEYKKAAQERIKALKKHKNGK